MRAEFICERCGVESRVQIAQDEDVWSGCQKIKREHEKLSPECTGDLSTIRCISSDKREDAGD